MYYSQALNAADKAYGLVDRRNRDLVKSYCEALRAIDDNEGAAQFESILKKIDRRPAGPPPAGRCIHNSSTVL